MSELDLFAIGRCQEQVTRENLESSACSLHSPKQHQHRIYAYAMAVVLLMLINELYRNMTNKYVSINNKNSNQTEIHSENSSNSIERNSRFRRCEYRPHHQHHHHSMMTALFTESVECSR